MRIFHCLRAPLGGLFRHVLDLAEEQADRGHDVGILADNTVEDRLTAVKFAAIAPRLRLGIARVPISRQPAWRRRGGDGGARPRGEARSRRVARPRRQRRDLCALGSSNAQAFEMALGNLQRD